VEIGVLAAWVVTATGGVALVILWFRAGGRTADVDQPTEAGVRPAATRRSGITSALVAPHATFAVVGLVMWAIATVVDEEDQLASARWVALGLLAIAIGFGLTLFRRWHANRDRGPDAAVPSAMVYAHGAFAAATLVGAVVAALAS